MSRSFFLSFLLSFFLSFFPSFFLSFFLIQSSVHSSLLINLFFSHSSIFSLSLCYNFSFSLSVSILTFLLFQTLACVYIFSPSLCFYSSFTFCVSLSLFSVAKALILAINNQRSIHKLFTSFLEQFFSSFFVVLQNQNKPGTRAWWKGL